MNDQFITIDEAAKFLGMSKPTVYGYTCKRKIPFYKPSHRVLFLKSELIEWMQQFRVKTTEDIDREATKYIIKNANL